MMNQKSDRKNYEERTQIHNYLDKYTTFNHLQNLRLGIYRKLKIPNKSISKQYGKTEPCKGLIGQSEHFLINFKMYSSNSKFEENLKKYIEFKSELREDDRLFFYAKKMKQSRSIKKINNRCPHPNRKYYAKGMCDLCYLSYGRNQLATKCLHTDRMNYALGMCLTCYHKNKNFTQKVRLANKAKKVFQKDFLAEAEIDQLDIFEKMAQRDP